MLGFFLLSMCNSVPMSLIFTTTAQYRQQKSIYFFVVDKKNGTDIAAVKSLNPIIQCN